MIEILIYKPEFKNNWITVLERSKNGTFLFHRDYMDYHSDRFNDLSFLIFKKGNPEGILPGNISDKVFYSHQGLTYGGLISTDKLVTEDFLIIFELINTELKKKGIKEVVYKPVPYIYHKQPSQEDIYALFKLRATKIGCNISSTIYQNNKIKFIESRKSGLRKSKKEGVYMEESNSFELFWPILNSNLNERYKTNSVHTLEEITFLYSKFPNNIKLFLAYRYNEPVAGTVIFLTDEVIHVQYISANSIGKECGALDMLFDELINQKYTNKPIFDFGQSTERMGEFLNENLIFQKEGFGGRGVVYDIYKYTID